MSRLRCGWPAPRMETASLWFTSSGRCRQMVSGPVCGTGGTLPPPGAPTSWTTWLPPPDSELGSPSCAQTQGLQFRAERVLHVAQQILFQRFRHLTATVRSHPATICDRPSFTLKSLPPWGKGQVVNSVPDHSTKYLQEKWFHICQSAFPLTLGAAVP